MKAIIGITKSGDYAQQALAVVRAMDAGQDMPEADYLHILAQNEHPFWFNVNTFVDFPESVFIFARIRTTISDSRM
ncbi:MAG: hypothetical protein DIZ77_07270 [endosymbiont of Seepiophila jonesi]|uniref:Uncharacterized protein n=1 Tax=endosymbiont of Lamellibrachia luymesi TaxID=2200907 RepID=A0A370DTV9_9GAMM|nr:MAG: hypothetical protein DIZ79_14595 [endosymbiont of Lamellibrachia luymesi]RDH92864.1 MAG: hypothetical protein DIZ77_07270 [endosymbiont of Seepiophila jonesi]